MSTAETLHRLQLLDTAIDVIRRRVFEIDQHAKGTPALAHTREEAARAEAELTAAQVALDSIETEERTIDAKIEAEDKRLYAGTIRDPKELVEVQTEVQELRRRRVGMDDVQMAALERVEDARNDVVRCRASLQQGEVNFVSDVAAGRAERKQLIAKLTGQAEQRTALVSGLPKTALDLYQSIRTKKQNGVAVAEIRNGACAGCGESVSSSAAQQAHTGNGTALCSNCGRLLYSE
ncbi:MAG: hypothetical protein NTZ50_04670 [Chloroflexi bacterium]|nr:hypothetical protein [Chloroflexota bacterium]